MIDRPGVDLSGAGQSDLSSRTLSGRQLRGGLARKAPGLRVSKAIAIRGTVTPTYGDARMQETPLPRP